ncbi:MAG: PorP/SprF family type IX secretion system membrane protein [Saprospiraceae bacterium]
MRILDIIPFLLFGAVATAQQEAVFSQFFYNKLLSNPGAAASDGIPSLMAFHRQQWAGLEGAPSTQVLSFNAPAFGNRVGLGLTLMNDRIGFFNSTYVNAAYAYRIPFGRGVLGIGIQGSYLYHRTDWAAAKTTGTAGDPLAGTGAFSSSFNVGAGAHFQTENFFAGVSVPYFLEKIPGGDDGGFVVDFSNATPHIFITAGGIITLSPRVKMRPAFQSRIVKNAPPGTDFHLSFGLLRDTRLWLGATYRWSFSSLPTTGDAVVVQAQYQISDRLRAGTAYDISLGNLQWEFGRTYELMLEYDFTTSGKGVRNPRYF